MIFFQDTKRKLDCHEVNEMKKMGLWDTHCKAVNLTLGLMKPKMKQY